MGQATSKRRSYTPGNSTKAGDGSVAKSSRANGDSKSSGLANGSIEVRSPGSNDSVQIEADDTTSPTSVTSDTSTGRKENKRKRFRVSGLFSLKRTPSGKWPRRRKTTSSAVNGTRPASCPDAPSDAGAVTSPARPQSLFLEELEIHEDDNKIETVDLSDHEQDGKSKQKPGKAAATETPKPPPKIKGRRGSKKQSSLKKKKQEKKSSKKDKKSKLKQKASTSETEDAATSGAEAEVPSPSAAQPKLSEKVDNVELPDAPVETIPCLTAAEERESSSCLATGLTQQVLAQIDAKSKKGNEDKPDNEVNEENEAEEDLDAVASSIVAETMDIAQRRLGEENIQYGEDAAEVHASSSPDKVEEHIPSDVKKVVTEAVDEHKKVVKEEIILSSTDVQVESIPPAVDVEINASIQKTQESTPSPQAPPRRRHSATPSGDIQLSKSIPVEVEKVANISESQFTETKRNDEIKDSITPETPKESSAIDAKFINKVEEQIQRVIPEVSPATKDLSAASHLTEDETQQTLEEEAKEKLTSIESLPTEHFNEAAVDVGAEAAAVAATVAAIESERTFDLHETQKEKVKTESVSSESDKQSKADSNEKKRLEKERLKKEKEAEKVKEKERLKEEKRKKAEQKSAEKEKHKSEKKISIPKRLSSLFHRKEKQLKQVEEAKSEIDLPSTSSAVAELQTKESKQAEENAPQAVETMVCPVDQAVVETVANESSSSAGLPSLAVDASVEPLSIKTDLENNESFLENQTSNEDVILPSAATESPLESPLSDEIKTPGSDTSEPTSPGSDYDGNGSSGGSNVLKKISLGPRLRTAILRKKSSGASDSGAERTVSLTTPMSVAESIDVTPPPRKLRPRKPVEQYSPVTAGAHNPLASDIVAEINCSPLKAVDTNNVKDNVINEINVNSDMIVEQVAVEVPSVDKDTAGISTNIQSDLSRVHLETETDNIKNNIEDKLATSGVDGLVVEKTSVMNNTLVSSVTNKLQSTPGSANEVSSDVMQLSNVSQTFSSNVQSEISETTSNDEPSSVVEEIIVPTTKTRVTCEPFSHLDMTEDLRGDIAVDMKDSSDTDDTDPSQLEMPSNHHHHHHHHHDQQQQSEQEQQQQSESDEDEESRIFSSLPSPTVVSTATIVLRPSSVDDTCPESETYVEEWIEPTVKRVKTTSTSVQTEYAKNSVAVTADSLSNVNLIVQKVDDSLSSSPTTNDNTTESLPEERPENFNLQQEVLSSVASDLSSRKDIEINGDISSRVKDILSVDHDSGEVQNGLCEKQVYTAVCMAQIRDDATDGKTKEEPGAEDVIVASSKPRAVITIAEYIIRTSEEEPQKEITTATNEESDEEVKENNLEPIAPPLEIPVEVAEAADSFFAADGSESADVTITEDTVRCALESAATEKSLDQGSEDSEDSGQQTPTPSSQHETVDSVINGIVNEAVNGVLHGEHNEKVDESMESEKSPPSSPSTDEIDSSIVIHLESGLVTDSSLPSMDDNQNATKIDDNDETAKEKCIMKETIMKTSPTDTIEAYLKLQYQDAGDNISAPFVNGEKGFEENANVLIAASETTAEIVSVSKDDQQMTG